METNQNTQTNSTQQPIVNKKMMSCKTCGAPMAKSAKKCQSCGAKNRKRKMKKLIVLTSLIVIAAIVIGNFTAVKDIGIGSVIEEGNIRMVLEDVQFEKTGYVIEGSTLKPIQKDDLKMGDNYIYSTKKNMAAVVITVTAENIGKNDASFGAGSFYLDYNDGNIYYANSCYALNQSGRWSEFDKIELEKVTSGVVRVCILAWIPEAIYDSPESLTLHFMGARYTIK